MSCDNCPCFIIDTLVLNVFVLDIDPVRVHGMDGFYSDILVQMHDKSRFYVFSMILCDSTIYITVQALSIP